ncbi:Rrf2 family transcriptional regulator [Alicyclobacillus sp. SP_1]|jgi:Rrf2 family nitric oxide-sensitive transcriptional repressor|uniref:Rrf2 family transcriptional regulator n=1 Tax=Alicyclobacillus sp. SP_1 TaxID=2942475 RepID=UPI0021579F4E|nr:Rrf2 family transcriptional regulator [Alicyclobacillus sp. SP_1]
MNLTRFSDYSLRILLYVALQPDNELSNIESISRVYRISNHHLVKVVHELGKLGYLKTVRGRSGGIRLAKPPEEICIGEVIRHTEDNWNLVECFDEENGFCILNPMCRLKGVFSEALRAYLEVLDKYTLADMIVNRQALQKQFELPLS